MCDRELPHKETVEEARRETIGTSLYLGSEVWIFSRRRFFGENIRAVVGLLWRGGIKALGIRMRK